MFKNTHTFKMFFCNRYLKNLCSFFEKIAMSKRHLNNVTIGNGKLNGKGVYAKRDFKKGDIVITYNLQPLTPEQFKRLSKRERMFTHVHWGRKYLYSEPERYVNHSKNPNTYQDLNNKCDVALRTIKRGEEITTNSTKDDVS